MKGPMRRLILLVPLGVALAACDPGTEPRDLTLDDVSNPPRNHATVVVTQNVGSGTGSQDMLAGQEYFLPLRDPPPLPRLDFDAQIGVGAAVVRFDLGDVTTTGTRSTDDPGVGFLFGAPDGTVFEPSGSCRITIVSALLGDGSGRLQGETDCTATDGTRNLRVLVKFDHSP
jgi:hypothetical protein